MKKLAVLMLTLALAACGGQQGPRTPDQVINRALRGAQGQAQPSKVVAAELGFARMAQEQGQWTAFAEYATDEAVMFVPEPVNAKQWLKGRTNPPQSVEWQPHMVWMSCDGSLALSRGAWQQPNGSFGYFTTVWQRQKDGEYRWVMDQGDALHQPLTEPEFIQTQVAKCDNFDAITAPVLSVPAGDGQWMKLGESSDRTLRWLVRVEPDGSRYVAMEYWNGSTFERPFAVSVAPPPKP